MTELAEKEALGSDNKSSSAVSYFVLGFFVCAVRSTYLTTAFV